MDEVYSNFGELAIIFAESLLSLEFLEKVLGSFLKLELVFCHQSIYEEWLCFVFLIKKEKSF